MGKVILILDEMPGKCLDCLCYDSLEGICRVCGFETKGRYRPAMCPIRKIPEREEMAYCGDEYVDGCVDGWNSCIDEILGLREEEWCEEDEE